jgi:hypothetical protein
MSEFFFGNFDYKVVVELKLEGAIEADRRWIGEARLYDVKLRRIRE